METVSQRSCGRNGLPASSLAFRKSSLITSRAAPSNHPSRRRKRCLRRAGILLRINGDGGVRIPSKNSGVVVGIVASTWRYVLTFCSVSVTGASGGSFCSFTCTNERPSGSQLIAPNQLLGITSVHVPKRCRKSASRFRARSRQARYRLRLNCRRATVRSIELRSCLFPSRRY